LVEDGVNPAREREIESLFAVGNGYFGIRASIAEGTRFSHPSTFVAGVFVPDGGVCTENLSSDVVVVKSAKDGV
jgi:trehalose/maltose hydrolase-like predicted phosphorylase